MKKIVTMSMNETTIEKIDDYAKRMGLSRSSAVTFMCETMLNQQKTLDGMDKLMEAVNSLKEAQKLGKIV